MNVKALDRRGLVAILRFILLITAVDLLILAGSIWRSQESGARRKPAGVL